MKTNEDTIGNYTESKRIFHKEIHGIDFLHVEKGNLPYKDPVKRYKEINQLYAHNNVDRTMYKETHIFIVEWQKHK